MSSDPAERWNAPSFGERRVAAEPPPPVKVGPSVEELAAIEKAAHDEGYAAGHKEGLAAGEAEVKRLQQQLGQLLRQLSQPMAEFDGEVADALGQVAVRIAGALLREAYQADPTRLDRLVDSALATIADQNLAAQVHVHPADLALLNKEIDRGNTQLVADSSLKRGDVRVHTPILRIDGSLQARLDNAFADLDLHEADTP